MGSCYYQYMERMDAKKPNGQQSKKVNTMFRIMLLIVLVNYVAQVPYYFHQYYVPHGFLPSLYGSVLLGISLIYFVVVYQKLIRGFKAGYYMMLTFLAVEFLFYLQTQVSQLFISHQLFLHVYHPDGLLLFLVFGIGYINFIGAIYFIVYLSLNKDKFLEVKK